jgi:SAM-dependent methyltransferase
MSNPTHGGGVSSPVACFPETADIETSSDDYASRFSGPVGEWFLSVQERLALDMIGPPDGPVLDVGGGHGQLARPLCARGYDVTVLGSAESCRRRVDDLVGAGRCRFVAGNVLALPFADRSFDAVLSFRLLPHCRAWPALVAELCRVGRRAVVVDYPVRQSVNVLAPLFFRAKRRVERNTRDWRTFTHREVADAVAAVGWRLAARRGQFLLPMALHRALGVATISRALEGGGRALGLTALWGSPVIAMAARTGRS